MSKITDRPRSGTTTYHRDGTVTLWDCLQQSWVRTAYPSDELYATLAHVNAAADAAFERDAVWPPGSLWERFETGRAAATLPLVGTDRQQDLLGKFPVGHLYRALTVLPAAFASHLAVAGEHLPHGRGVFLPKAGAVLDVGEKEGNGSTG